MSLEDCQGKCSELSNCDSITVKKVGDLYECFRKGSTALSGCDSGTEYDTYLFAGNDSISSEEIFL
jgi:predicted metal-binding protein